MQIFVSLLLNVTSLNFRHVKHILFKIRLFGYGNSVVFIVLFISVILVVVLSSLSYREFQPTFVVAKPLFRSCDTVLSH